MLKIIGIKMRHLSTFINIYQNSFCSQNKDCRGSVELQKINAFYFLNVYARLTKKQKKGKVEQNYVSAQCA
jgi:hypothetical protein